MARKAFTPSEEQRHLVKVLSSYGIKQGDIATEVGLRSPKTLRKHFREDLDRGRIEATIKVRNPLAELDKSDPMRTHASDAVGYWIAREFPMRAPRGERGGPSII